MPERQPIDHFSDVGKMISNEQDNVIPFIEVETTVFENGSIKVGKPAGKDVDKVVKFADIDVPHINRFLQGNDFMPPKEVFGQ